MGVDKAIVIIPKFSQNSFLIFVAWLKETGFIKKFLRDHDPKRFSKQVDYKEGQQVSTKQFPQSFCLKKQFYLYFAGFFYKSLKTQPRKGPVVPIANRLLCGGGRFGAGDIRGGRGKGDRILSPWEEEEEGGESSPDCLKKFLCLPKIGLLILFSRTKIHILSITNKLERRIVCLPDSRGDLPYFFQTLDHYRTSPHTQSWQKDCRKSPKVLSGFLYSALSLSAAA